MKQRQAIADAATRRLLSLGLGELVGCREPDGTHAWRGIAQAQPPVGALRWRAPQPVAPWTGVRQALQHGPMAPQQAGLLAPVPPSRFCQNVLLLMASPLAAGLFHRAIAQSPVCQSFSVDEALHSVDSLLGSESCGSLETTRRLRLATPTDRRPAIEV